MTPRPAATTMVVRDGARGLEVLMVRRSEHASFMPGAYVFPGGAVDAADAECTADESADALAARVGQPTGVGNRAAAFAVAALRECFEECGLWLGVDHPDADLRRARARLHAGAKLAEIASDSGLPLATRVLHPWSHWVTPVGLPKRFDTLFFVAPAPRGQQPTVDAGETTTLEWVHPPDALARHAEGRFAMEFATVTTMQSLQPFAGQPLHALLAHAASGRPLPPLHPRLELDDQGAIRGVLLPGDPGWHEAAGDGG